jgi:tetratricopeptide (TPR) repeat protein
MITRSIKLKLLLPALIMLLAFPSFASQPIDFSILNRQDTLKKYGEDSVTCVVNLSLYREFFKQWRASDFTSTATFNEIKKPWRWVFLNCPIGSENIYVDGARLLQYRIENEKDQNLRSKLIDTLMMVYDQRITYFPNHFSKGTPQEGSILGRKGIDLYTYDQERYEETYNILKRSVDLEGDDSDGTVLVYYFRSVIKMARKGLVDSTLIVDVYDQVIDILDHNIDALNKKGDTKWLEHYKNFKGNIDATFEPFATCEDLIRIFDSKLKKNPEDVVLLKKITNMLDKRSCQDSPLYLSASKKLHSLEPSPESAYLIGRLLIREEKYSEALSYMEEATKMTDTDKLGIAYKLYASSLAALKNYPRARQMALKALEINPNDGNALLIIGDLYAASAKDCGDNDFTSKTAYWVAVDKYARARNVDPTTDEAASKRIATYSAYFPDMSTIFFHDYKEGDTYTVGCWINETTIIRAAK